jgi:schlafen family protein
MRNLIDRALTAQRENRRIEFKDGFNAGSEQEWREIIRDVAAMANSGGGVIAFGVDRSGTPTGADLSSVNADAIVGHLKGETASSFDDLELHDLRKHAQQVLLLLVGPAATPIVVQGRIYVRRGARSEPGNSREVAAMVERRINAERRSWLNAVRRVILEPPPVLSSEVRESESADAVPIRVVDDPHAQAFRLVDYDKTHPYRQKELLAELRQRIDGLNLNQFDLLAVRYAHNTDARPDFSHKGLFGTRQYSPKFLQWLEQQIKSDPRFLLQAREQYQARRLA